MLMVRGCRILIIQIYNCLSLYKVAAFIHIFKPSKKGILRNNANAGRPAFTSSIV